MADDGTILTANHVIAGGGTITVTFADGTTANAVVAAADPKLDIATLTPAKLPQVVVPATARRRRRGGSARRRHRQPARPDRQRVRRGDLRP